MCLGEKIGPHFFLCLRRSGRHFSRFARPPVGKSSSTLSHTDVGGFLAPDLQVNPSPMHGSGADIGCATGCFPAMQLACGIEMCTIFEVRDVEVSHPKIEVRIQDLSNEANLKPEFDLVTCLSTIEHVGLGRYGDPLDPRGDIELAQNLRKLVRRGGIVLMSFPVGVGCVVYNLHRIYTPYRRAMLFQGYNHLGIYTDLSLYPRLRHAVGSLVRGRVGRSTQPVHVLTVA